jgi:LysM repeat protein
VAHKPAGIICDCDEKGWMPGVEHIPPKWEQPPWIRDLAGKMKPIAIVDHIMVGFLRTMVAWASNGESKVIVHFGIDVNGRIVQFQPVHTPGRHASAINSPESKLVRERGQDKNTTGANGYTIGIEHEGTPAPLSSNDSASIRKVTWSKSNPWPDAMVRSSIKVKVWCFKNVDSLGEPSADTIIGHYAVDARNRPDDPALKSDRSVWPRDFMINEVRKLLNQEEDVPSNAYIVQRGDTLSTIAQKFNTTKDFLAVLNGIEDPNKIQVGWVLRLNGNTPEARLIKPPTLPPAQGGLDRSMMENWFQQTFDRVKSAETDIEEALKGIEGALIAIRSNIV